MKKEQTTHEQQDVAFREMIKRVKTIEHDKDTFLKAARLSRMECKPLLDGEDIMHILAGIGALLAMFILFALPLMLMGR